MAEKTYNINAPLPKVPEWVKANGSIKIPLNLKSVNDLVKKLKEITEGDNPHLEIGFTKGKNITLALKYNPKSGSEGSRSTESLAESEGEEQNPEDDEDERTSG